MAGSCASAASRPSAIYFPGLVKSCHLAPQHSGRRRMSALRPEVSATRVCAPLTAWRSVDTAKVESQELGRWGNVIAALIYLDRPQEALFEGEKARKVAETSGRAFVDTFQFSAILENMAFARMQLKDYKGALNDIATANAFREDDLTKQNLALSLIIADRRADAQKVLRQIAPPMYGRTSSRLHFDRL